MTTILPLDSQPDAAIEALLDTAFGPDRHGRTAYAMRRGMAWIPSLSYAILADDGSLVGTLQSWPVALHDPAGVQTPLIMVGPVAVLPERQGDGFGRALMDRLISDARVQHSEPLMMIGDPEYYGRFWGFSAEATGGWDAPGPFERRRLLALSVDGKPIGGSGMIGPRLKVAA